MPQSVYVSPSNGKPLGRVCGKLKVRTVVDLLSKAKVHEFQMSFCIYQDVLRLQVPVCHALLFMKELEYEYNFGRIELRGGFIESSGTPEIAEYFTSRAVVELEILA